MFDIAIVGSRTAISPARLAQLRRWGVDLWSIEIGKLANLPTGLDGLIFLDLLETNSRYLSNLQDDDFRNQIGKVNSLARERKIINVICPISFWQIFSSGGGRLLELRQMALELFITNRQVHWSFPVTTSRKRLVSALILANQKAGRKDVETSRSAQSVGAHFPASNTKEESRLTSLWITLVNLLFVSVAAPISAILFLALRASDLSGRSGPVIFSQRRVGREKRIFACRKFRTMKDGTRDLPSHEVDPRRITQFGRVLRRSKLDELPQFVNVIMREMDVIGYRPCLVQQGEIVTGRSASGVTAFKPGITGLAQVAGVDMSAPENLVALDTLYYQIRNPLLDIWILLMSTNSGTNSMKAKLQVLGDQQLILASG